MNSFVLKIAALTLLLTISLWVNAHNNPTFREDLLLTVEVSAEPLADATYSQSFSLEWPAKTVQLIWRITGADTAKVSFAVAQDGTNVAEALSHDMSSGRLKGEGFTIVDVVGADAPFTIEIYAKVLDRSLKKKS